MDFQRASASWTNTWLNQKRLGFGRVKRASKKVPTISIGNMRPGRVYQVDNRGFGIIARCVVS